MEVKPIIKCPGGKRKLMLSLGNFLPDDLKLNYPNHYTYIEPFFGGGSPLLYLVNNKLIDYNCALINDFNFDIINLYRVLVTHTSDLIEKLDVFCNVTINKQFYLNIRNAFNTISLQNYHSCNERIEHLIIDRAALFLTLNKTCFNGLIRYNKSGLFNAPFGNYKNPKIYDIDTLLNFKNIIQNCCIHQLDFESFIQTCKDIVKRDNVFIYLDPPYLPLNETANFSSYTSSDFLIKDHYRIQHVLSNLPTTWKFMLSGSNTELTKSIFKKYNIKEVSASRSISAKSSSRKQVKELVITNY